LSGAATAAPLRVLGLVLRRLDVAAVVDLSAGERVAPRATAVLGRVVVELVARVAERRDAGEVVVQPIPRAAALSLHVCARAREVLHAEESLRRRAARCKAAAEGRHGLAAERAADAGRKLRLPARAPAFDGRELAVVGAHRAEAAGRLPPDANAPRVRVEGPRVALDASVDVVLNAVGQSHHRLTPSAARWTSCRKCEDYRNQES